MVPGNCYSWQYLWKGLTPKCRLSNEILCWKTVPSSFKISFSNIFPLFNIFNRGSTWVIFNTSLSLSLTRAKKTSIQSKLPNGQQPIFLIIRNPFREGGGRLLFRQLDHSSIAAGCSMARIFYTLPEWRCRSCRIQRKELSEGIPLPSQIRCPGGQRIKLSAPVGFRAEKCPMSNVSWQRGQFFFLLDFWLSVCTHVLRVLD